MVDTTFIYALNDPETGECRYVGKADNPKKRLVDHCSQSHKETHHCANWIRSLATRGLRPLLEILQEVPKMEWELWERVWIKASRKIGMNLTNVTDGGDCGPVMAGEKHPFFGKTRPEMRGSNHPMFGKNHSPETIAKMSGSNHQGFGKKASPETRSKMSASHKGKKHSLEAIARMRTAQKGKKVSSETRAKISATCRVKKPGASSSFFGVSWVASRKKWRACFWLKGKLIPLGRFLNENDAAKAYDVAAKKYLGESTRFLNFPNE